MPSQPNPTTAAGEPRPRSIFCVVADIYRDLEMADAVCAGRFDLLGMPVETSLPPEWLGDELPVDKEWRVAWHKFYYGLDLAHAFAERGEERYLETWRTLVLSFLDQVPLGSLPADVAGRRIQNWIYAWNCFADADSFKGLGADVADRLIDGLLAEAAWLREHLTPERNHRTLELTALFNVAIAFPDRDSAGELLAFALSELTANLLLDVLADGVHRERSTHYHLVVLRNFLGVRENCRRFEIGVPDGFDERLERACDFALHCHRPDGEIPAFSDADGGSYLDLLALAADLFHRDDLLFAASGGRRGKRPEERYASFPLGGYYVQRSPWSHSARPSKRARYLLFDCGPIGDGGHGHYDALHFELAGDEPLLVDPGRFTYDVGEPDWRYRFKGTAAHNTVLVDDLDQTPYQPGKPARNSAARARLLRRSTAPSIDLLVGEVRSRAYEARHRRHLLFVGNSYWIVEDRLRGDEPHCFELRYHLPPAAQGDVALRPAGRSHRVTSPGLELLLVGPGEPRLEEGWVSPEYGRRTEAPVVALRARGRDKVDFLSLLLPHADGTILQGYRVARAGDGVRLEVDLQLRAGHGRRSVRDTVMWSDDPDGDATFELGPLGFQCRAVWIRRAAGEILDLGACGVRELRYEGKQQSFTDRRGVSWNRRQARPIVHQASSHPELPTAGGSPLGPLAFGKTGAVRQVESAGGEPAVVLIHGWGLDLDWWRFQLRSLRRAGRRVLAYDLRGLGGSAGGDGPDSMARLVDDLAARTAGLTGPLVCGHALGALVALEHAVRGGDLGGLLLVNAPIEPQAERQALADRFASARAAAGLQGVVDATEESLFSPPLRSARPELIDAWRERFLASSGEALEQALRAAAEWRLEGSRRLELPTLCIDGAAVPSASFDRLRRVIPCARREVLERAAQLPQVERAEAFDALLADFLKSLPMS